MPAYNPVAIMGAPKHFDHHGDVKHREAVFARVRGELLREAGNRSSFDRVKAKVLNEADVQRDSALRTMVQAFIAEREAIFKAAHAPAPKGPTLAHPTTSTFSPSPKARETQLQEARLRLEGLERLFRDHVRHFHEVEAEQVRDRIQGVVRDRPDLGGAEILAVCETVLADMRRRHAAFLQHVSELSQRAVAAAQAGDHNEAGRILKRLSSIHALHPQLLPDATFDDLRSRIIHSGAANDDREALRHLVARERAVASELNAIAAAIRRFHDAAHAQPHDTAAYHEAEAAYHRAVNDLTSHDADWLAGLILELLDLLAEYHDPPPEKAQEQVDKFIASVRSTLKRLRREVSQT